MGMSDYRELSVNFFWVGWRLGIGYALLPNTLFIQYLLAIESISSANDDVARLSTMGKKVIQWYNSYEKQMHIDKGTTLHKSGAH